MHTNFWAATSQDQFEGPKCWDIFPVQQLRAGTSSGKMQGLWALCIRWGPLGGTVALPGSLGSPSSAVRPCEGTKDGWVPRGRMGSCMCCLWFLLPCKFSVAIPCRKLYAPGGLTHPLHLFAVTEVAHVCHGHTGKGA